MNKKTKSIIAALVVLVLLVGGIYAYQNLGGDPKDKTVEVIIKNAKGKEIFNEKVGTNAKKLSTLLKEMKKDKKIKLKYENSTYGMYITGMGSDKLISQDIEKGLYWMYTSDNNKSCVEAGYCDGADTLKIADKDTFVFALSNGQ